MEHTVEEIMTGKLNIDQVLQENKEKIQSITSELEEIVRKGYFDILQNTETLIALSNTDAYWPSLSLPDRIEVPEIQERKKDLPLEDAIWDLLNNEEFLKASELIKHNQSHENIAGLKAYMLDPHFYSIFETENPLDRLNGIILLTDLDKELIGKVIEFLCMQLVFKLKKAEDFDRYFLQASDIIEALISSYFFCSIEVELESVSHLVSNFLSPYLEDFSFKINKQILEISDPSKLTEFLTTKTPQFGIPCVWELSHETWRKQAYNLIMTQSKLIPLKTLTETIENFEELTKNSVCLIRSLPLGHKDFIESISQVLSNSIFSEIDENASPILLLGFIRKFQSLSISQCCGPVDLSQIEEEFYCKVLDKLKEKSIFEVCQEVKSVCGDYQLDLERLEVQISPCRRGFGRIIRKSENAELIKEAVLPIKKPLVDKISLPPRFAPHLILS